MVTGEERTLATSPAREGGRRGRRVVPGRWWAPGDIVIVTAVAALSVFLIVQSATGAANGSRLQARITANGEVVMTLPLDEDSGELSVEGYQGESHLEIDGGRARMLDSACPDKLCVRSGWIDGAGESVVCLPNRVVIEITGGDGGPDVVNQ